MTTMSKSEQPISEQFRIIGKQFIELDKAARLLEETKTSVYSEMKNKFIAERAGEKVTEAQAEREVKASPEWREFINAMVDARSEANLKKIQIDYIKMQFTEWQMSAARSRDEYKMGRAHA